MSENLGTLRYCHMQIEGKRGPGRPKMTWRTLIEGDRHEWKLNEVDSCDRDVWRKATKVALVIGMCGDPM